MRLTSVPPCGATNELAGIMIQLLLTRYDPVSVGLQTGRIVAGQRKASNAAAAVKTLNTRWQVAHRPACRCAGRIRRRPLRLPRGQRGVRTRPRHKTQCPALRAQAAHAWTA